MNLITIILQRLRSENPQIFKFLSLLSGILAAIISLIFWADNQLHFNWLSDAISGLMNDTLFTCIGIFSTSNLTTTDKNLSNKKL
jgi:hypothetical protein